MEQSISQSGSASADYDRSDKPSLAGQEAQIQRLEAEVASLKSRLEKFDRPKSIVRDANGELQRARLDLMASEERFRLLVEGVRDYAIFMLDVRGYIISWNTGASRIKGYTEEEILGKHFSCFYPAEDIARGKPARELQIAFTQGRYEEEGQRLRNGGQLFWALVVITPLYDDAGSLRGFAKVTRDISERRREDDRKRLMVELATNAMILVDSRGLLVLANPQTEKLFGYTQAELLGNPVEMLIPESARHHHPLQLAKFFANPSVRSMGAGRDLSGRRKDGSEFPVEIALNPVNTDDDFLVMGSIVDITERKRAEDNARRHLAELAHAGRLSTLGEMFSGLAHEINQPLAAASNYARACLRMAKSETGVTREQLLDWIEKAAAQADRASDIVRRLGMFVKKDGPIRTRLNINHLIEKVIALPTLLASTSDVGTRTTPLLELQEPLAMIFADKVQIEQVLVNLVRNAIEAMDGIEETRRTLVLRTQNVDGMVEVTVCDNGPGISAEDQKKLFSPFFTTKSGGMGLGLSISRSIIETHRGQMFMKSNAASGTSFIFQLPIELAELAP